MPGWYVYPACTNDPGSIRPTTCPRSPRVAPHRT